MKRANLTLDAHLLETAKSVMKAKTYSDAVNQALLEAVRLHQIRNLFDAFGTGAWEGSLPVMREDSLLSKKKKNDKAAKEKRR